VSPDSQHVKKPNQSKGKKMKEEDLELGQWSARRFVDSGEKPEFIRTCEAKVCIMPASKVW